MTFSLRSMLPLILALAAAFALIPSASGQTTSTMNTALSRMQRVVEGYEQRVTRLVESTQTAVNRAGSNAARASAASVRAQSQIDVQAARAAQQIERLRASFEARIASGENGQARLALFNLAAARYVARVEQVAESSHSSVNAMVDSPAE